MIRAREMRAFLNAITNGSFRKVLVEAKLRESRLDCADSPFFIKDNCVVCSSILNRTDSFSLFVDGVDFDFRDIVGHLGALLTRLEGG